VHWRHHVRRHRVPLGIAAILLAAVAIGLIVALLSSPGGGGSPASGAVLIRTGVVWAVGDGADGGDAGRAVAARIRESGVDRVLYLGDVYETGSAADFSSNFGAVYGGLVDRMWPTPGNHDWPAHAVGYDAFWAKLRGGRALSHYYSGTVGGWQVISLNSEEPHDAGSPQMRWLAGQLKGSSTCRIAFWHRPRFSDGLHGDQADMQPVWDAVAGHAALVLNGHDHDYQRFKPIGGTTEIVSGAGGHDPYPVRRGDPRVAFADDRHFGALRLTLHPGSAGIEFVASDGTVLDRSQVGCRS
jgi:hypothetical protein